MHAAVSPIIPIRNMNGKRRQNVSFYKRDAHTYIYIHKYIRPSSLSLSLILSFNLDARSSHNNKYDAISAADEAPFQQQCNAYLPACMQQSNLIENSNFFFYPSHSNGRPPFSILFSFLKTIAITYNP